MADEFTPPPDKAPRDPGGGSRIGRAVVGFFKGLVEFLLNFLLEIYHLFLLVFSGAAGAARMVGRGARISVGLFKGHLITLKYMFRPKVTVMYPFERSKIAPYFRGRHYQVVNEETGRLRCDGCTLCAKVCPTSVIDVIGIGKGENKIPKHYTLNLVACVYCGMCVDICPEDAIKMVREFELASPWRPDAYEHKGDRPLVLNLEDMMIYESAIYPDGRSRNKHLEEDITKHMHLEHERKKKEGTVPAKP